MQKEIIPQQPNPNFFHVTACTTPQLAQRNNATQRKPKNLTKKQIRNPKIETIKLIN